VDYGSDKKLARDWQLKLTRAVPLTLAAFEAHGEH
jgi:hypothetical protein